MSDETIKSIKKNSIVKFQNEKILIELDSASENCRKENTSDPWRKLTLCMCIFLCILNFVWCISNWGENNLWIESSTIIGFSLSLYCIFELVFGDITDKLRVILILIFAALVIFLYIITILTTLLIPKNDSNSN
ncbi:hypothetical protein CWI38_0164p0010 [Hamiltosporidium tvaerminnensis]|uniref:Uncharacterized protein n=1 Tax=Hamiltosporidium tvaerminnensis TaxID=1176355 RepID=A0A4V2JY72_9MICR|nr:hypothetical protein CWI38_0585p0010 [Hamiltosporidium tvaerminnensis]TBU19953.1 hypothetical protein CWI38_0164p0010 [Hamiltosporidium tvaerminnensis]